MNSNAFAQALLNDNIKRLTKDYCDADKKSTPKRIFEIAQFFTIESLLRKYFQEDSKKDPNNLYKLFLSEAIAYLDNRKYSSLRKSLQFVPPARRAECESKISEANNLRRNPEAENSSSPGGECVID